MCRFLIRLERPGSTRASRKAKSDRQTGADTGTTSPRELPGDHFTRLVRAYENVNQATVCSQRIVMLGLLKSLERWQVDDG